MISFSSLWIKAYQLIMEYTPSTLASTFSPNTLIRQYVICQRLSLIPEGWIRESLGEFWLGVHPDLPVNHGLSENSRFRVCFLGDVIDPFAGKFNCPSLEDHPQVIQSFDDFEAYLHRLSGRFVCVVTNGESTRIYLDASGSLPLVFDVSQQIASSSLMVIPYGGEVDDDSALIELFKFHQQNGIYPFGLTPRKKIKRVLPNHYLCLDSWCVIRHWPSCSFKKEPDRTDLAEKVGGLLESTISTILKQGYKPYMSLTAGVDSRTLLACTLPKYRQNIHYFTWELPDATAMQDVATASSVSRGCGVKYSSYPYKVAKRKDQLKWLYRTSLSIGEVRGQSITTTVSQMDAKQPYIAGNVSLITLGKYWREGDDKLETLAAKDVVQRLRIPESASILQAAEEWLSSLPSLSVREVTDLLYLEQRVGCWGSEIGSGHADGPFHIYPLSNRKIFEWSLQAQGSQVERSQKALFTGVIRLKSPDLLRWAFNGRE
ncbi:MAG: Unknown protein [uncultured Thiotrichaceae bacterium]|uniref:Asparagine synthetase domain-containing protein n=1 Tax=uncultured Thiotrichaceae bacterium TaxID=298394 RepID=A0A6S6SJQ2_9GAMM|nr:MAG: Unknown protein [uncultured Thiotrichaceae bacterium]